MIIDPYIDHQEYEPSERKQLSQRDKNFTPCNIYIVAETKNVRKGLGMVVHHVFLPTWEVEIGGLITQAKAGDPISKTN
jgi:hypothetical protein